MGVGKLLWSIHTRPSNYLRTPETSDKGRHAIHIWKRTERNIQRIKEAPVKLKDKDALMQIIPEARPVGLGAVLTQVNNGGPRIISYASRSLTSTKTRCSQTEKEALALIWA